MCINPSHVWVQRGPNWEQQPVACRQCWRCRQNRVNDYVARAMAEAATSAVTATVTLTYAPRDDLADKVLHPRHFQLFMKLLRRAGHKVRYLVAGEYGDLRGRAHFHALLFFQHLEPLGDRGPVPAYGTYDGPFCRQIPQKRMVHIREWPHGHVKVDWSASEKSARYVCKYLLADNKNNAWFSLSKKPPLGAAWFARKAALARELGVLPSSFEYLPPGGSRNKVYLMTGATRRDYLNAITQDESDRGKMSEWVQKSFDKYQRLRAMTGEGPVMTLAEFIASPPDEMTLARQEQKAWMMSGDRERQRLYTQDLIADLLDRSIDGTIKTVGGKIYAPDIKADQRKRSADDQSQIKFLSGLVKHLQTPPRPGPSTSEDYFERYKADWYRTRDFYGVQGFRDSDGYIAPFDNPARTHQDDFDAAAAASRRYRSSGAS